MSRLINITETEWWMVQEAMEAQDCETDSIAFGPSVNTRITLPSGDRYVIQEYNEHLLSVRKLEDDEKDF